MMTPYDKLKSLPDWQQYLQPSIDAKSLEAIAMQMSDNESAKKLQLERKKLFKLIFEQKQFA